MNATATPPVATAWHARAEDLADWALARFFVRRDRYGGYKDDGSKTAHPGAGSKPGAVNHGVLLRHFRATCAANVIGAYHLTPTDGVSQGRTAAGDIDAHDEEEKTEAVFERNRRYAEHAYFNLAAIGFRPLLTTWGGGSFHLEVLFDADVPGPLLHAFGAWVVSDAKEFGFEKPVESFPKQDHVAADKYGNWLRMVGRHHSRDVWASVFDGVNWLEGEDAVAHVLTLTGDPPDLIPAAPHPAAVPPPSPPGTNEKVHRPASYGERPDVFQEYKPTLADVVGWLERAGHTATRRTPDRVDFTRAGKHSGESFNVKVINGAPVTFCFSTNAGLPDLKGIGPVQLRCHLEYGSIDTAAMAKLAAVLKEELGWPKTPKTKVAPATVTGDGQQSGAQIILAHFRELYAPVFKIGTAIHCGDGSVMPMGEACALCDSRLIDRLEQATDAARYVGRNGEPGQVKRTALPGFFKTWAKVAWGDLLRSLPDEDGAELGDRGPAREEFRRLVRDAMLTQVVLGESLKDKGRTQAPSQTERRSLIDWCHKFAKVGPWKSIRSYRCWCKAEIIRGELLLRVAVRHELFGQLKADRRLCQMGQNTFTRRVEGYGIGRTSRSDRPEGQSAVVFDAAFLTDLLDGIPDEPEQQTAPPGNLADSESPSGLWWGDQNSEGEPE